MKNLSQHCLEHQEKTKTARGKVQMDYIWGASVVETCLQMMTDLWEIGNKEAYDKEKVTKQQKRKAKAAISVWAMYKLRYQAQPSNIFLFY